MTDSPTSPTPQADPRTGAQVTPNITELDAAWRRAMQDCPPLGTQLRHCQPQRWRRFYLLPEGALPQDHDDIDTALHRFFSLLNAVGVKRAEPLLVTTCAWGDPPLASRPPELSQLLPAAHWRDVPGALPADQTTEVFASVVNKNQLTALMTDWVLTGRTADVMVFPASVAWLCHPYDAGIDVVAAYPGQATTLADEFSDWASKRPDGL